MISSICYFFQITEGSWHCFPRIWRVPGSRQSYLPGTWSGYLQWFHLGSDPLKDPFGLEFTLLSLGFRLWRLGCTWGTLRCLPGGWSWCRFCWCWSWHQLFWVGLGWGAFRWNCRLGFLMRLNCSSFCSWSSYSRGWLI